MSAAQTASARPSAPRAIDHCVLPTADLERARERLTALGFTVAPEGSHPFGTRNACVYFKDDTFLEALAVGDAAAADAAVAADNVFVARDRLFRAHCGEEGFSALVMRTDDADADHARFVAEGLSAGPELAFSRPVRDAAGGEDEARFKLAFATAPGDQPGAFFFACERVRAPQVDRVALTRHQNGVTGIDRVVLSCVEPDSHEALMRAVTGSAHVEAFPGGTDYHAANGLVSLLNDSGVKAMLAIAPEDGDDLRLRAIVFRAPDLERVHTALAEDGIEAMRHAGWLIVPPAEGQGAIFAFEEHA